MKTISLVNTDKSPCPYTHNRACIEFIEGFKDFGFVFSEETTFEGCVGKTILLLSNHNIDINYLKLLNSKSPNSIYILWCFDPEKIDIPFNKYIITFESYVNDPILDFHKNYYKICKSIKNYVPLLLRANENPNNIESYKKDIKYNASFIGSRYKPNWAINIGEKILYYDISNNRLLSSEERKNIYLNSLIVLGFHSDANIINSHVTQRVFEGLCYGCVVISDNPSAQQLTNNIVEYASTKEELKNKIDYFLNNHDKVLEKRNLGYEWCKKYGTNRFAAQLFLDKINELWSINLYND